MNVRLFLLIAMTAFFGALWSSDQQYQETQMAVARAARKRGAEHEMALLSRRVAPRNETPSTPASPFARSSWVAAFFATPSLEVPDREPVIATRVGRCAPAPPTVIVAFVVSFRRPSFRFDGGRLSHDVRPAEGANPGQSLDADLTGILRWADRLRFEIDGETCWMRWQIRRTVSFAKRRAVGLLRQQWDWRDLVQKVARGAIGPLDPAAKNAAVPGNAEER
jgi:hypothetical protein